MGAIFGFQTAGTFFQTYRARNLIERFFNMIKQCRRVASSYGKSRPTIRPLSTTASIRIWLQANESTPWQPAGTTRSRAARSGHFIDAALGICPTCEQLHIEHC
jgi:hypothetical protein